MKFTASVIGCLAVFTALIAVGAITPAQGGALALAACALHWAALLAVMAVKVFRKGQ